MIRVQETIVPRKLLEADGQKEREGDDDKNFAVNVVGDDKQGEREKEYLAKA